VVIVITICTAADSKNGLFLNKFKEDIKIAAIASITAAHR
jgi:hypothetical protein